MCAAAFILCKSNRTHFNKGTPNQSDKCQLDTSFEQEIPCSVPSPARRKAFGQHCNCIAYCLETICLIFTEWATTTKCSPREAISSKMLREELGGVAVATGSCGLHSSPNWWLSPRNMTGVPRKRKINHAQVINTDYNVLQCTAMATTSFGSDTKVMRVAVVDGEMLHVILLIIAISPALSLLSNFFPFSKWCWIWETFV